MKILVVSDTHRNFNALKAVTEKCPDFDTLIHLGDGEKEFEDISALFPEKGMIYVKGNCDYGQHEQVHIAKFGSVRIFCSHGHTFGVKYGLQEYAAAAKENRCNVALYGHTHICRTEFVDGVFMMNPGSPCEPRGGNPPTFGVINVEPAGEIKMEIIPL